jgi:hypothetical protein
VLKREKLTVDLKKIPYRPHNLYYLPNIGTCDETEDDEMGST